MNYADLFLATIVAMDTIIERKTLAQSAEDHGLPAPEAKAPKSEIMAACACGKTFVVTADTAKEAAEKFAHEHVFTVDENESWYCKECRPSHRCCHCYEGLWEDEGDVYEEEETEFYEQFGNCFSETYTYEQSQCCDADVEKVED